MAGVSSLSCLVGLRGRRGKACCLVSCSYSKSRAAIADKSGLVSSLSMILSPPKDEPLRRLSSDLFLRRHNTRKQRPRAIAVAPMLATTTPAICGFERVGAGDDAGAAVAVAVDVADDDLDVVGGIIPPAGEVDERVGSKVDDEERNDEDELDVIVDVTPELVLDATEGEDELLEELEVEVRKELLTLVRVVEVAPVVDAAGNIFAVRVPWRFGIAFGMVKQTPYTDPAWDSETSSQLAYKHSKAPSPMVKPDVLFLVHKQPKFSGGPQMKEGNDSAIKVPRQL